LSPPDAKHLPRPKGEVTFDRVSLQLDGEWILKDVSLHIKAGQVVALVGPTGCGKTLLVNLIARVKDPTRGRILIDGVDVRDLRLDELRKASAFVPQTTFLFSQRLDDNVRMGLDIYNDEAIDRAIHISRMSNDLPDLPKGLATMVGEKGVMLSGGQKQRVAIARAIIRDPAILVLDDALSSVDTHTAAEILSDLREVLKSRTSIIIAHRIATVKDADHIIVMDEGRIVEQGTHDELVANDALYARMVERELREEDLVYGTGDD
jgi:ATP-binding cassette subfamily B protein